MGIYDRDYNRGYYPRSGFTVGGPTTVTTKIVIVMFAVYIVQLFTMPAHPISPFDFGWFTHLFELYPDVFKHPLHLFQLLTYGFLHHPGDLKHILFNMFGLWMFGRDVEYRYGTREYLTFFLVSIVAAGVVWVLGELVANRGFVSGPAILGASGGVTAVVILFALNFPNRTILLMFVLPMPMWVAALLFVGYDAYGAIQRSGNVAFTAHLGGALFAFAYFQAGWRLDRLIPSGNLWKQLKPKPKLRVHDPETPEQSTEDQVDEILKKIQEHGRASLTRQERRILEEASKQYQKKKH
jgi:rhomboid family protein